MSFFKRTILPVAIILLTVIITVFSDNSVETALLSMKNTMMTIIPTLFPYMVLSSLIISSGAAQILGELFPIARIFTFSKCASMPLIMGALCGFPLGAKATTELYEKGYLSKTEAEALLGTANNTGPTFLIFVIGKLYFNDVKFGCYLYVMQLICAFLSSFLVNKIIMPFTLQKDMPIVKKENCSFLNDFSSAVRTASISSIHICGFIAFFSIISSLTESLLFFLPVKVHLTIKALLEFSETCRLSSEHGKLGFLICGFSVGWSGFSVLCQTATYTDPLNLSLKRYVCIKLLSGILLGTASYLYDQSHNPHNYGYEASYIFFISLFAAILIALGICFIKLRHKKTEN